jgi:hypothetical protein
MWSLEPRAGRDAASVPQARRTRAQRAALRQLADAGSVHADVRVVRLSFGEKLVGGRRKFGAVGAGRRHGRLLIGRNGSVVLLVCHELLASTCGGECGDVSHHLVVFPQQRIDGVALRDCASSAKCGRFEDERTQLGDKGA